MELNQVKHLLWAFMGMNGLTDEDMAGVGYGRRAVVREDLFYDSYKEAMELCKLNPDDAAYWERGMLCPFHTGVEEGMRVVLEWLNRESK